MSTPPFSSARLLLRWVSALSVGVLRGVEFDGPCRVRGVGGGDLPDGYYVHPVRAAAERGVPVLLGKSVRRDTPNQMSGTSPIPTFVT